MKVKSNNTVVLTHPYKYKHRGHTREQLSPCLPVHVLHHRVVSREGLEADLTSKVPHAGVAACVAHQVGPLEELLVAVVALVFLEAGVAVLVRLEVGFCAKAPTTEVTDVRLLFCVHTHVGFQSAGCQK